MPIPALTEERRREYVRVLHKFAEEARVASGRRARTPTTTSSNRQKDGELSEDQSRREQDEVQKLTDQYVEKVDELLKHKEAEIMEV